MRIQWGYFEPGYILGPVMGLPEPIYSKLEPKNFKYKKRGKKTLMPKPTTTVFFLLIFLFH